MENYFYRVRLFRKRKTLYRVKLENMADKTVEVARLANFLERALFNKQTVIKVIPVTELFEEYKVFTGNRESV